MARDIYHYNAKEALIKDGWTVTDDPLALLTRAEGGLSTDLGAEKIIVAEKGLVRIAVEVKSFLNPSVVHDFLSAIGQFKGYESVLKWKKIDRIMFLAMPQFAYDELTKFDFVQEVINDISLKLIIFDENTNEIVLWKN
jgi:hypothetical protein